MILAQQETGFESGFKQALEQGALLCRRSATSC
jgi:hypothetical protein